MKVRILRAVQDLGDKNRHARDVNPVKRVPLIVSGGENQVVIEVLDDDEVGQLQDIRQGLDRRNEQVRMQNAQLLQLRRELAETRAEAERQLVVFKKTLARMSKNIHRLSNRLATYFLGSRRRGQRQFARALQQQQRRRRTEETGGGGETPDAQTVLQRGESGHSGELFLFLFFAFLFRK